MTNDAGLKPCPFCGGNDLVFLQGGPSLHDAIKCRPCNLFVPLSKDEWNRRDLALKSREAVPEGYVMVPKNLLMRVIDWVPCRLDHHAHCQTHYLEAKCSVDAIRNMLAPTAGGCGREGGRMIYKLPQKYDRMVTRRFDPVTGREREPFIEVSFMQDRMDVRPGDCVRVTVTMLHKNMGARKRRKP